MEGLESIIHVATHVSDHVFDSQGTQTFAEFAAASLAKVDLPTHMPSRMRASSKSLRGGFTSYEMLTISQRKTLVQDTQNYIHSLVRFLCVFSTVPHDTLNPKPWLLST